MLWMADRSRLIARLWVANGANSVFYAAAHPPRLTYWDRFFDTSGHRRSREARENGKDVSFESELFRKSVLRGSRSHAASVARRATKSTSKESGPTEPTNTSVAIKTCDLGPISWEYAPTQSRARHPHTSRSAKLPVRGGSLSRFSLPSFAPWLDCPAFAPCNAPQRHADAPAIAAAPPVAASAHCRGSAGSRRGTSQGASPGLPPALYFMLSPVDIFSETGE
jgi:hypothetical protein